MGGGVRGGGAGGHAPAPLAVLFVWRQGSAAHRDAVHPRRQHPRHKRQAVLGADAALGLALKQEERAAERPGRVDLACSKNKGAGDGPAQRVRRGGQAWPGRCQRRCHRQPCGARWVGNQRTPAWNAAWRQRGLTSVINVPGSAAQGAGAGVCVCLLGSGGRRAAPQEGSWPALHGAAAALPAPELGARHVHRGRRPLRASQPAASPVVDV